MNDDCDDCGQKKIAPDSLEVVRKLKAFGWRSYPELSFCFSRSCSEFLVCTRRSEDVDEGRKANTTKRDLVCLLGTKTLSKTLFLLDVSVALTMDRSLSFSQIMDFACNLRCLCSQSRTLDDTSREFRWCKCAKRRRRRRARRRVAPARIVSGGCSATRSFRFGFAFSASMDLLDLFDKIFFAGKGKFRRFFCQKSKILAKING